MACRVCRGHVQFGVPGLINHALQCRGEVMEVELRQLGVATASHEFSFRQPRQRAGEEQGCTL